MKDFGAHLKNARQAAGMTLEDIHDVTRISLKNLRLIESGDFPSIPQTYVRAFVREYARAVGLDEVDTLAYYNEAAETEKGIPRPPENIDSSNLRIEVDDTIEYIEPLDRPTSHVEVEGTAEVAPDDYVPPVRKSRYVDDDAGAPIDIRTTSAPKEALSPPSRKAGSDSGSRPGEEEASEVFQEGPHRKDAHQEEKAAPTSTAAEKPEQRESAPTEDAARTAKQETPPLAAPPEGPDAQKRAAPPDDENRAAAADTPRDASAREASEDRVGNTPVTRAERAAKNQEQKSGTAAGGSAEKKEPSAGNRRGKTPPPPPPPRTSDTPNEKRIIGVGLVIIAIIVIAVYGIFYFGADGEDDNAQVDSTAIKASIEAGRFIDSSQYAMTELEIAAEDTIPAEALAPPEPVESKPRVFERSDSLVLEAFTSAPVWFSVKMDTLRTERGSLSSKEHRVWKARDYFVITLGDAGAVTFFLNGKEIGTLGEEGAVVKNVTLSRRQLEGN